MIQSISPAPIALIGPVEILLLVLVVLVILFGQRAPEMARNAGEAIGEFQQSREQVKNEVSEATQEMGIDEDIDEIKGEVDEIKGDVTEVKSEVEESVEIDDTTTDTDPDTDTEPGTEATSPDKE